MDTNFVTTGSGALPSSTNPEKKETNNLAPKEENTVKNGAENALNVLSYVILVIGIISVLIMLFMGITKVTGYRSEEEGYAMLLSAGYVLFGSILFFYVLKVFCNISNNLHEMNMKMKEKKDK